MSDVNLTIEGKVGIITLNHPADYNALSLAMLARLLEVLDSALTNDSIRALVITGSGKGFCSGAQFGGEVFEAGADLGSVMRDLVTHVISRLRGCDKPVVTAINGAAAGAGVGIALAGDIVIAAQSARFLLSFVKLGATLDAATSAFVQRAIGPVRARGMALLGEPLGAADAERFGLVWKTVADEALMTEAVQIAEGLANGPPLAIALIKQQLEASWAASLDDVLELEADNQIKAFLTEDLREGAAAFAEKRKPRFQA